MEPAARRSFKGGISGEDARRKREDARLSMRKQHRMVQLHKRRIGMDKAVIENKNIEMNDEEKLDVQKRLEHLPEIIAGLNSTNPQLILAKVIEVRQMLSVLKNPPIQEIIDADIVPKLIWFLGSNENPKLQFEAAWALTNIASGTTEHTWVVIENGAVPIFMALLVNSSDDIREQALWALGNIAGDSCECRDIVLKCRILDPLLEICTSKPKLTILRNATWTLSNLCRGKSQIVPLEVIQLVLPVLSFLLNHEDEKVLSDVCWSFSYISDDTGPNNERIAGLIRSGAVPKLTFLLGHKSDKVKHPALRTIGNIVCGDDLQTQVVLDNAALPRLLVLLTNKKKVIRKEACWTISNITAGSVVQIQAVMENSLFQPVISLLHRGEFDVKKEAAWAITNATSGGSPEQVKCLIDLGCLGPLCELLNSNNTNLVLVVLEALENILELGHKEKHLTHGKNLFAIKVEECGGVDSLEKLQCRESFYNENKIYEKLILITRKYFDGQIETSYFQAPHVDVKNNTFQFNASQARITASVTNRNPGFIF